MELEVNDEDVIRIGFYMPKKKMDKMNFYSFIDFIKSVPNIQLHMLNPLNGNFEDKTRFDLFLNKLTDELMSSRPENDLIVENVKKFISHHPCMLVIDPIENQRKVLDRALTYQVLSVVEEQLPKEFQFRLPRSLVIYDEKELCNTQKISFPVGKEYLIFTFKEILILFHFSM